MLNINKTDLDAGLDLLMNVPQLRNINTNKEFKEIFMYLMEDSYIDRPTEILNHFKNEPNDKLTQTLFLNYGILPEYYEKLNPMIKRKLIYYLELLFQQKGSIDNLKIISELFTDFFKDINYYGISVNKLPYRLSGVAIDPGAVDPLDAVSTERKYILSYYLKPIIISKPELLKYFPNFKIDLTGKYLMKLEQFQNYNIFPKDTNLLYIDFIDSSYLIHSDKYFIESSAAFTFTKHQDKITLFDNNALLKMLNPLHFRDIDLILQYFNLKFIRYAQIGRKKLDPTNTEELMDIEYKLSKPIGSSLIFDPMYLDDLELLVIEYKNLKGRNGDNIKKLKDLSRRFQFLLQSNYVDNNQIKSFKDLENFIDYKYPALHELFNSFESKPGTYSSVNIDNLLPDELIEVTKTDYINFLMNLYIHILNDVSDGNEFVDLTINAIFQNILNSSIFIEFFFTPVFKLFINYFMPGNMDYIVASDARVIIHDKFEAIFMESEASCNIKVCELNARYLPCNKINIGVFMDTLTTYKIKDDVGTTTRRDIFDKVSDFQNTVAIKTETFNTSTYKISENPLNIIQPKIIINEQKIDKKLEMDSNVIVTQYKYNFFSDLKNNYIKNYIWKLERNSGVSKQIDITKEIYGHFGNANITALDDYLYMKQEMYSNINNYLFYKNNYN
jgi:hypothetical protein